MCTFCTFYKYNYLSFYASLHALWGKCDNELPHDDKLLPLDDGFGQPVSSDG